MVFIDGQHEVWVWKVDGLGLLGTHSQKLPALLMWNAPAPIPPRANPRFVGIRIEPADAGDQPRIAIAYTGV